MYITFDNLMQFSILIIGLITLVLNIVHFTKK